MKITSRTQDIRERANRVVWHDQDETKADRAHLLKLHDEMVRALTDIRDGAAYCGAAKARAAMALEIVTGEKPMTIHAFNTGRGYTAKGQRIAWTVLSTGNAAMLDIDRGIDYILIKGEYAWSNQSVLHAYDHNRTTRDWDAPEYAEARALQEALRAAAAKLLPNKEPTS
jgi:hypothetical protein